MLSSGFRSVLSLTAVANALPYGSLAAHGCFSLLRAFREPLSLVFFAFFFCAICTEPSGLRPSALRFKWKFNVLFV